VDASDRVGRPSEIALVPPVSGGHDGRYVVTERPLVLATVVAAVTHPGAGGIATFIGNVRGESRGKPIDHLDYEAYVPMAEASRAAIAGAIEARIQGSRVAIHHRIGRLAIGESAVIIAASAPHRAEAFEACRDAIEALKRDVPIWKREHATDGTSWFGRGA
jgi:MoaE-MoaD fusion protein